MQFPLNKKRRVTSDYLSIDVRKWQRGDLLKPGTIFECRWNEIEKNIQVTTESDKVILNYRYRIEGENWKDIKYAVQLDWTPCNFGGKRAWFLCPAIGCGKRVAILKTHELSFAANKWKPVLGFHAPLSTPS
nr:MAG: hypothetical protein BECKTUN1418F_GA0071002_100832 [Candidatus Kentron sp. TUN]VFK57572.1 MAG: hypothetical protein BECKTUN1418D_GA0071000_10657 [Candidatus Kentron sp. TUN]